MPHPVLFAAIAFGGVVVLGVGFYMQWKEFHNSYQQYERPYDEYYQQQRSDMFRHSNDFDFDQDSMNEDNTEKDSYYLHKDTTQLRSRRPYADDVSDNENKTADYNEKRSNTSSLDQDNFELSELESSIAERKRRLMAEQAFLDREEENLRNRLMELKRQEEQNFYQPTVSNLNKEVGSSISPVDALDPFVNHFADSTDNDSDQESYCYDKSASSSGDKTAILISKESDAHSVHSSDQHHMSSSNLQFPDASQTIATDSETALSINSSDSEESWDAVSEHEWTRRSDSEYEH